LGLCLGIWSILNYLVIDLPRLCSGINNAYTLVMVMMPLIL